MKKIKLVLYFVFMTFVSHGQVNFNNFSIKEIDNYRSGNNSEDNTFLEHKVLGDSILSIEYYDNNFNSDTIKSLSYSSKDGSYFFINNKWEKNSISMGSTDTIPLNAKMELSPVKCIGDTFSHPCIIYTFSEVTNTGDSCIRTGYIISMSKDELTALKYGAKSFITQKGLQIGYNSLCYVKKTENSERILESESVRYLFLLKFNNITSDDFKAINYIPQKGVSDVEGQELNFIKKIGNSKH